MNEQNSKYISFMALLKQSLIIFKHHFYDILFLTSIPFLALSFLYIYSGDGTPESILTIPMEIISIIYALFFISFMIVFPVIMQIVKGYVQNESITMKEAFTSIKNKLLKLFFAFFLIFIIIMVLLIIATLLLTKFTGNLNIFSNIIAIGFSCLFIKMLINFLFFQQSIVLRELGSINAFKYSALITKKRWWKVFNFYFLFSLCIFLILNSISLLLTSILPIAVIYNIAFAFINSLTIILTQIFLTLLFLVLDER